MPDWLYVLVSVAVAAFVGGVTNHFAIKMLFHPRKPIHIGKFHVPFTPGLIPKRRDDIAASLGQVVAEYLVTAEGLQETVLRPAFRNKAEDTLRGFVERVSSSELTLREAALRVWSEEEFEALKSKLTAGARATAMRSLTRLWEQADLSSLPVKRLVPGWSEENRKAWSAALASALLGVVEEELLSASGQRMLSKMAAGLMDRAGGFLGTMAAIFVDEDKLVQKMTPALVQTLRGEDALNKTAHAIETRLELYGEKPVAELLALLTGEEALGWLNGKLEQLPLERWLEQAENRPVRSLIEPWKASVLGFIPVLTERTLRLIAKGIPAAMQAVDLPGLVEEQVSRFPIERLEEVILSVSGKEFRAITWLGVVLGGIIGLLQSLLLLLGGVG
ncbi:DUF445 family protein [Paenibacillus barengoltzii]|uniref:Uncharacterized membrane protein YheB, UPF0754 family n=1 Tax=Paenibacillus barengoltzii J12 TaxID=935846 RepID=A0ABY1LZ30_9BACL|nr:DUF445 family protein [Paenibacillus barengoltzii]SMF38358.1 Uncharacterized membrane protein YheB, UPF0754 family [Paenibacillus barengoltzii J12]